MIFFSFFKRARATMREHIVCVYAPCEQWRSMDASEERPDQKLDLSVHTHISRKDDLCVA